MYEALVCILEAEGYLKSTSPQENEIDSSYIALVDLIKSFTMEYSLVLIIPDCACALIGC